MTTDEKVRLLLESLKEDIENNKKASAEEKEDAKKETKEDIKDNKDMFDDDTKTEESVEEEFVESIIDMSEVCEDVINGDFSSEGFEELSALVESVNVEYICMTEYASFDSAKKAYEKKANKLIKDFNDIKKEIDMKDPEYGKDAIKILKEKSDKIREAVATLIVDAKKNGYELSIDLKAGKATLGVSAGDKEKQAKALEKAKEKEKNDQETAKAVAGGSKELTDKLHDMAKKDTEVNAQLDALNKDAKALEDITKVRTREKEKDSWSEDDQERFKKFANKVNTEVNALKASAKKYGYNLVSVGDYKFKLTKEQVEETMEKTVNELDVVEAFANGSITAEECVALLDALTEKEEEIVEEEAEEAPVTEAEIEEAFLNGSITEAEYDILIEATRATEKLAEYKAEYKRNRERIKKFKALADSGEGTDSERKFVEKKLQEFYQKDADLENKIRSMDKFPGAFNDDSSKDHGKKGKIVDGKAAKERLVESLKMEPAKEKKSIRKEIASILKEAGC